MLFPEQMLIEIDCFIFFLQANIKALTTSEMERSSFFS